MRGVFISYRRDDTAGYAGRLYDALTAHFGRDLVFFDIDSIPAGQNFVEVIEQRMAFCSVVIVLIGKAWLNSTDGRRRLDDPHDFVRLEIANAFRRKIPVIPVLVGGAKMPRVDDLPALLTPLAHLNAIEIFDQLFRDSVRRLVNALRPLVYSKPWFLPWYWPLPSRFYVWVVAFALLAALGIAGIISSLKHRPAHNDTRDVAPLPSETLIGPEESGSRFRSILIKTTKPPDVTELPPVVEASRKVMLPGSSSQVTGPVKPRILWRAHVVYDAGEDVVGIAADGTLYMYSKVSESLYAVRDGKEQWAYTTPSPVGFDAEGRIWLGGGVWRENYCFNSRGEGGRVTRKNLVPDRATLTLDIIRHQNRYDCSEGKVYAIDSRGEKTWAVDLDGECGHPTITPQTGNIYVSSDALTLYALTRDGQVLWTVKQACKEDMTGLYPLPNDDLIVSCRNQPLYLLREGKSLWTATLGAPSGWVWTNIVSDGAENIYVSAKGPPLMTDLTALDKSGKQMWKISSGTTGLPTPIGFDAQGRLYVYVSERIVALSR
jgi:hypothetical protein